SLVPELAIGDCLVADQGLCGEGTSAYYSKDPEPKPSADLCGRLQRILDRAQMSWHKGRIWSTDAPYREARSLLREVHERHGIVAVDMEYTALCTVAAFRGVKLAALFVISDEIWRKQWTAGFTRSDFKLQLRQTITELLAAMAAGNFSEQSSGGQDNA
ncbi:MAG: hypothetical protein H8E79_09190, partial [Desulfobulbaceae bacterium]|nr:hypothetical protein [Candidatus Desulfatifera sulfidica]